MMRKERIKFWKCPECYGTGKVVDHWTGRERVAACEKCDGTGNGLIDGETERHKRNIERIERARQTD